MAMKYLAVAIVLLLSLLVRATEATSKVRVVERSNVLCHVVEAHETGVNGHREYLQCNLILKDGSVVHGLNIDLPEDIVDENEEALHHGEWFVNITGATIEETFIEGHGMVRTAVSVPLGSTIVTVSPEDGRLASSAQASSTRRLASTGIHKLLVLRVSVNDSTPTSNATQLNSDYFDMNSFSLVRQYYWCSFGQIQFQAYDSSNPVIDVVVSGKASSFTSDQLWPLAMAAGAAKKGVSDLMTLTQHVAIILPPKLSNSGSWYAVGTIGYGWTLYNDQWGAFPNFAMHELGHNLGMGHAGVGSDEYADSSDIMGYGDTTQFGISKCFNGYHYSYLQWFASRSLTVNPYSHSLVTLAAFADYNLTSTNQSVVVKADSYYLVYNRRKGINYGVNDAIDKVTIVQSQSSIMSTRLAALDTTTTEFQVANYGGGSLPLVFKICTMTKGNTVDVAYVSIGVGPANCTDGLTNTQISPAPTPYPTTLPTKSPTFKPTTPPTRLPTAKPTNNPTKQPTRSPTRLPTLKPTRSPSRLPTLKPTSSPTPKPTKLPTSSPTPKPSKSPTAKPTKPPTSSPTPKPTKSPTAKPTKLPTASPTPKPTKSPTQKPTKFGTTLPPTPRPTSNPTRPPTKQPTLRPTQAPSKIPTTSPTLQPVTVATLPPTEAPTITPSPVEQTPAPGPVITNSPTITPSPVIDSR